jgi:type VI secretion system secreted protein VgrG
LDTLPLAVENIELSLTSKETTFSVRTYRVEHALSTPFDIRIEATCKHEDVDLDAIVGLGASLRVHGGETTTGRTWTGVCAHAEQVEVEPDGLSTYQMHIVPTLWRTTHRKNSRIFQHLSLPDIAVSVLKEWKIEVDLQLDRGLFPRFEYRVQYGETDFVFLTRILEEAGISYTFRDPEGEGGETKLVLVAEPHTCAERAGGPLPFVNRKDFTPRGDHCSHVKIAHRVRTGHVTVRDFDFQARPDLALYSQAKHTETLDAKLEVYEYLPGSACIEASEGASARVDEREAKAFAERKLVGERHGRRGVELKTSCLDLHAGAVVSLRGHPRRDLEGKKLLVTRQVIEGTCESSYTATHSAVFADEPYKPRMVTPKPRISGVQSALVVGPSGQEIHTDDFGRVRVQFHWDREGKRDEHSSCFIRVSQAWAGRGYGVHAVPRVGDEVLIGFFEGDPDQPVITGRVHNSASRTPHNLPAHKTRTSWKSESSPGGEGWSEITLDDLKGEELVFIRAEKDMERVVKNDETVTIGASLKTSIGINETIEIKADQSTRIAGCRSASIEKTDRLAIGESLTFAIGESGTSASFQAGKRIVFTTGEASIVLDGPNIYFDAKSAIRLSAGALLQACAGEVHIDGGPNVFINSGCGCSPGVAMLGGSAEVEVDVEVIEGAAEAALGLLLASPAEMPGSCPEAMAIPAYVERQLEQERIKILAGVELCEMEVKSKAELMIETVSIDIKQNLVPRVEACRKEIQVRIDQCRALVERVKGEAASLVVELKTRATAIEVEFKSRVQMVQGDIAVARERVTVLIEGLQERVEQVKAQARQIIETIKVQITQIKDQVKTTFDTLRRQCVAVVQSEVATVKATIDQAKAQLQQVVVSIKVTIDQARAQVQQIVTNVRVEIQQVKQQAEVIVGEIKVEVTQVRTQVTGAIQDARGEVKGAIGEVKQEWSDAKGEVKQTISDVKGDVHQTVTGVKQEGQQITGDVKGAWGDVTGQGQHGAGNVGSNVGGHATTVAGNVGSNAGSNAGGHATTVVGNVGSNAGSNAGGHATTVATNAGGNATTVSGVPASTVATNAGGNAGSNAGGHATAVAGNVGGNAGSNAGGHATTVATNAGGNANTVPGAPASTVATHAGSNAGSNAGGTATAVPRTPTSTVATNAGGNVGGNAGSHATTVTGAPASMVAGNASTHAMQSTAGASDAVARVPHAQLGPTGAPLSAAAAPKSGILTKPGALGSESVARTINTNSGASYLQSPTNGQMMVMRTQASSQISSSQLSSTVVEHQMNGMSSTDALAAALQQHGYAVYERPWDGIGSDFIRKAVL